MSGSFLRASGACWIASAFTTLALIFLPRFVPIAPDLDSQARLAHDPVYITRVWVSLVHPLIVLVGALGVLYARFRERPGSASTGFLFFSLWAFTEAIKASLTIVALNWDLAPSTWPPTTRPCGRTCRQITGFDAVWDGLFFVPVIAFIIANLLFMVAVHGGDALQRWVSVGFVLGAGLGIISLATSFGGGILPAQVMDVLYPALQPAARFLTGRWLLRLSRDKSRSSTPTMSSAGSALESAGWSLGTCRPPQHQRHRRVLRALCRGHRRQREVVSEKLEMKVTMREPNTNGAAAVAVLEGDGLIVELIQHDSARPLTTAAPAAKEPSTSTASSRWGSSSAISRKTLANVIVRDNAGNLIQFFGNESKE